MSYYDEINEKDYWIVKNESFCRKIVRLHHVLQCENLKAIIDSDTFVYEVVSEDGYFPEDGYEIVDHESGFVRIHYSHLATPWLM